MKMKIPTDVRAPPLLRQTLSLFSGGEGGTLKTSPSAFSLSLSSSNPFFTVLESLEKYYVAPFQAAQERWGFILCFSLEIKVPSAPFMPVSHYT